MQFILYWGHMRSALSVTQQEWLLKFGADYCFSLIALIVYGCFLGLSAFAWLWRYMALLAH